MFSVTKSFKIPVGHRLSLHKGRCCNVHGHNIRIELEITRKRLNKNFMVIDFYDLKRIANEIIDEWDHALLLNIDEYDAASTTQRRFYFTCGDPTSENMCFVLYNMLHQKFVDFDPELSLKSVTVWESDESKAKYEPW